MDSQIRASNALVRKRTDTELMPAPPPVKKIKRPKKVIDEDTYTDALSQIIARDFFPGLLEAETQQEYLDALESKDKAWISSAGQRLQRVMTPGRRRLKRPAPFEHGGRTPSAYGADTPVSVVSTVTEAPKPVVDTNMSLANFQATYTSEDNESFYKLMDKQNQKKAEKYAWIWRGNKLPSKQMIKQAEVETKLLETRSLIDDGWKRDRLAIKDADDRPAQPNSWNTNPKNNLMFGPDGVEDDYESPAQKAQAESRMAPKSINYQNTRIPQPVVVERPPSPTMTAVRDAIAGRTREEDRASTALGGGETPRVNGYAFVDDEDDGEVLPVPIINLGPGDATPNPFKLQDQRKRESLHHRLVERAAQSNRESARIGLTGKPEKTPVPKFSSSPRVSSGLTPAAQRFADFAVDLAAVLSASRSVASKHVALRGRQLESFTKASSLTRKSPTAPEYTRNKVTTQPTATTSEDIESQTQAPIEVFPSQNEPTPQPPSIRNASGIRPDSGSVLSHLRQSYPSGFSWSDASPLEAKEMGASASAAAPASKGPIASYGASVSEDPDDLPPGVNVNIFHSARAAKLLGKGEDQAKATFGKRKKLKPVGLPEFVDFSRPIKDSQKAPSSPAINLKPTKEASEPPNPVVPEAQEAGGAFPTSAQPVSKEDPFSEAVLGAAVDQPAAPAYVLRESKVPATRLSRLWNYGGLAAGMMGGAITESIGRAFGGKGEGSVLLSASNMERLVSKLSRMRGAALKMGQMMSFQDTKMLPGPIQEVLQRVQDRADYMPAWQRDKVLAANLGPEWRELFGEFEEKPVAAASIGQVHRATLKDGGRKVAVKIQFPGVADSINSDLDNLGILLTATKLLPKGLYLNKTIDNARLELGWECDYDREAQCLIRYKELLADEPDTFLVPDVHLQACGKNVLTMDWMEGAGVTRVKSFTQEQKDWIGTQILRLCLREITEFKFMQTDPNWTNFLYNAATNKLELLDFGASREYPDEFVTQYVELLAAASKSDREGVKQLSEGLGYLTGHESKAMVDAHVKSVLTLAEPFLESAPEVYDFHDQTITERVKALIPVMLRERLAPPPEETYSLHRKLSGAFLLCAKLGSRVRCREMFAESLRKNGYTV
ncbi:putative molecular chaperone [Colletotrichum falcatum]|nr:putative molecular chaperone [Colletotrichum falcatum]